MFAAIGNKSTCSTLLWSRVLLVHALVQKLAVQCKEDSVHGAADHGSVQQLVVQGNENSVQEPETTELSNNLKPADWRVPLISFFNDSSKIKREENLATGFKLYSVE
jgi:hypothetical protein